MESEGKVVAKSEDLKERFCNEFYDLMTSRRIPDSKYDLFKQTLTECSHFLTNHENILFAKNGETIRRYRTMFNQINPCIVLLLISTGEFNTKELGEKFGQVPKPTQKAKPKEIVRHWLEQFRSHRLIKPADYSEGMEKIYTFSPKYPNLILQLDRYCRDKYLKTINAIAAKEVPPFFKDILNR